MASSAIDEDVTGRKKKRKRELNGLKLYVGKKVEIRSTDNGFQGSWHPGNVLSLDDILCSVQYDHLLSNGGLVPLIESFSTSSTYKGNFRGRIRPIPPQLEIEKWSLDYGLCVDVLHNDAWWEGVVFDHENGAEERRIFYPDLGDEMNVRIEMLRMTHDWDEVSEFWKPRGNWLFLELIEEYTQKKLPLLVSVKQLWYDVREKKDFGDKIFEWTFRWRTPWEDIVWKAIVENFRLSMDEIIDVMALKNIINLAHDVSKSRTINEYDCSEDVSATEAVKNISQFVELHPDLNNSQALVPIGNLSSSDGDVQMCNDACGHSPDIYFVQNGTTVRNPLDGLAGHGPYEEGDLFAQMLRNEEEISLDWDKFITPMEDKGTNNAGVYMKPHASLASHSNPSEFCSVDSIVNTTEVLRKFLGREDEAQGGLGQDFAIGQGSRSVSMKCTDGGITDLMNDEPIGNPTSSESNPPFCVRELGKISCRKDVAQEQVKAIQNSTDGCRRRNNQNDPQYKPASSSSWLPAGPDILPRVEFCPGAILEYAYGREKGKHSPALALKVRMHLAYLGWKIKYRKDDVNRKCYISPDGVCYMSLVEVCRSLREPTREMLTLNSQDSWRNSSTSLDEQLDSGTQHISFLPFQQMKSDDCCNSLPYAESGALDLSEMKMSPAAYDTDKVVEPEYCPQAVVRWYEWGLAEKRKVNNQSRSLKSTFLSLKAKKHLAAVGWRFWYAEKRGKWELRYTSPWGKCYYSLRTACKACMDKGGLSGDTITSQRLPESTDKSEDVEILNRNLEEDYLDSTQSMMGNINVSDEYRGPLTGKMSSAIVKKGKISKDQIRERNNLDGSCPVPILRSSKRARQVVEPSTLHRNPRTVLSLLIDKNVVLPRARVRYIGKKNQLIMAEGRICRDGIKCSCCQKVFTLSGFEAHAGSTYHRPSARIFLEDGRSLLECQTQMVQNDNLKSSQTVSGVRTKDNQLHCDSDYICSICQYGGELVMCDRCPSTFHIHCLGLKDVPEGEWFCSSCCCGICGRSNFNENAELFTEKTVICCDQCEHEYHVGCLRERELLKLESHPQGNFFCSKKCKEIFLGLLKLLGKSIPVGDNNLSWTILKSCKSGNDDLHNFDTDTIVEHHSKLNLALGVMHECFEPLKEPRTNRDLFEDVIFSRGSELNRLNFRGFYTVLLERKDELISVATVRVFGERVAEVPLVGTRVKYRRLGMCRILMNELEKTLMELGVERILLPAVPHVINTWTTSFGFSRMTDSERLKFLDCTFLDFRDTIMCRKILLKNPVVESRTLLQLQDASFGCCDNIDLDRHSIGSEVIQAEEIEENEIMQQVPVDDASGN